MGFRELCLRYEQVKIILEKFSAFCLIKKSNFVCFKRNMETSLERTTATPSPAGAPISSTFYYIPGTDEFRGTYAGLDEKSFYNQRVHPEDYMENMDYSTYTGMGSSSWINLFLLI